MISCGRVSGGEGVVFGNGFEFCKFWNGEKNRFERFRSLKESIKNFLRVFYPEFDRKVGDGDFEIWTWDSKRSVWDFPKTNFYDTDRIFQNPLQSNHYRFDGLFPDRMKTIRNTADTERSVFPNRWEFWAPSGIGDRGECNALFFSSGEILSKHPHSLCNFRFLTDRCNRKF